MLRGSRCKIGLLAFRGDCSKARLDAYRKEQERRAIAQQGDVLLRSTEPRKIRSGLTDSGARVLQRLVRRRLIGGRLLRGGSQLRQLFILVAS